MEALRPTQKRLSKRQLTKSKEMQASPHSLRGILLQLTRESLPKPGKLKEGRIPWRLYAKRLTVKGLSKKGISLRIRNAGFATLSASYPA